MEKWNQESYCITKPRGTQSLALNLEKSSIEEVPWVVPGDRPRREDFFRKATKTKKSQKSHLRFSFMIWFLYCFQCWLVSINDLKNAYSSLLEWKNFAYYVIDT